MPIAAEDCERGNWNPEGFGEIQQHQECHAVTHTYFMTYGGKECQGPHDFLAIVDTACTKSVAGYPRFEQFYKMSDALELPYEVIEEKDSFKFGASRVFESSFAIRGWFAIEGHWLSVKVAIVPCPVPLLFSKPVLSQLGMKYDLAAETVTLSVLGVKNLKTQKSSTGHPALLVSQFPELPPPAFEGAVEDEVWVPAREAYMAAAADRFEHEGFSCIEGVPTTLSSSISSFSSMTHGKGNNLFYPKKIPLEVQNMLSSDVTLSSAAFFTWWKYANQCNDF